MKKQVFVFVNILSIVACVSAKSWNGLNVNNGNQFAAIAFTENKGQVHDQYNKPRPDILYGVMTGNMAVHIRNTGVSYQLYRVDSWRSPSPLESDGRLRPDQQTIYRIDLSWLNCNNNFTKTEDEVLPNYNNYYLENCPNGALNVRSYKGVALHNLYKGIDLHYYIKNGELKYDYIIAAHANYKQIQIQVEGAEVSVNEDGSLLLVTPFGKIQEAAPVVFQNGEQLEANWVVENNILRFVVENYNSNYELIIDPITRLWGSYYGSIAEEGSKSCTYDSFGNIYMVGYSTSSTSTLVATSGAHQSTFGGFFDTFLVKFDIGGTRLWATYYGGTGSDLGNFCATDASGSVYLVGNTSSTAGTVIATPISHQSTYGGGTRDAFLVKFNSNGIRQWGTYYGGTLTDQASSCTIDMNGNIYLAGNSNSSNAIATPGSHQSVPGNGGDAFLVKFNSNGVRQWGTYYGGAGQEWGFSCATDLSGNIYLAGSTYTSTNAIATVGSHQSSFGGGTYDGYLVKFNSNGVRQWGTYYGGSGDDESFSCTTDALGNVYLAGSASSNTGTSIATAGSHQSANAGGAYDAYLAKFDANGVRQWGTYYGGTGDEEGYSCYTDANTNVYLAGFTDSNTGTAIATVASHQSSYGGGAYDGFIAKFDNNGNRQWGTYYGGTGEDRAYSCVIDNSGSLYLAGYTDSNSGTAIATPGSHQSTYGGGTFDAFLAKFDVCETAPVQPSSITGSSTLCSGSASMYSVTNVPGATSYTWSLPAGWSGANNTNIITPTPGTSGQIAVTAGNACGTSPQQILNVTVHPLPNVSASSTNSVLCEGETATITASGALSYTFNPGGSGNSITVSPTLSTSYTVTGTDANACSNTAVFTQSVDACSSVQNSRFKIQRAEWTIFPNPTVGPLNLELHSDADLIILNALGQQVYMSQLKQGTHQINLEHLPKGIYIVKVGNKENSKTVKLIKE